MSNYTQLIDDAKKVGAKLGLWREDSKSQCARLSGELETIRKRVESAQRKIAHLDRENRRLKEENVWLRRGLKNLSAKVEECASIPTIFPNLANIVHELLQTIKELEVGKLEQAEVGVTKSAIASQLNSAKPNSEPMPISGHAASHYDGRAWVTGLVRFSRSSRKRLD